MLINEIREKIQSFFNYLLILIRGHFVVFLSTNSNTLVPSFRICCSSRFYDLCNKRIRLYMYICIISESGLSWNAIIATTTTSLFFINWYVDPASSLFQSKSNIHEIEMWIFQNEEQNVHYPIQSWKIHVSLLV